MARWQPDAAERLTRAALDLFVEEGYENTTVNEIAARAGLTKSTFFRHFPDKREVLFSGGEILGRLLAAAIAAAPTAASPLEALTAGLDAIGVETFTAEVREFSAQRRAVIAANTELQERDALKSVGLSAAMTDALTARGVPDLTAYLAAELGILTMKVAYERWSDPTNEEEFGEVARRTLHELRAASALLC